MKLVVAALLGSMLATLTVNAQNKKPPALQNVTISSVEDGDYYSLHVDFDYSGTGTCQCLVKTVQGRQKTSFATIKKCFDKFSMSVRPGRYSVEIKCKSGRHNQQVSVPEMRNCETLEDINNGSVNMTGDTPGSNATYNCNQDYQLKGPATRTCLSDGTWSGTEPTCIVAKEKMCKSLATFGEQILSTSIGGTCTLSSDCIDMRCQFVRNFGALPNVIIITQIHLFPCAKPPAISYKVTSPGRGTFIDGTFNESRNISGVFGTTSYEVTIGITQRPCGLSAKARVKIFGRTIHLTPPGVEGKIYMSCDCDCGHPGDIDHGTVDVSGGTMIGDTATYQCDQCFQLNGEDTRTCQDDGTWSGTAPTCQVPVESMCQSLMNMATSLTTTSIGTFGECTVSSDCLSLRCLGLKLVVIPGVFAIDYDSSVTLLPCQTPYGMLLKATAGDVIIVNGVFAQNTILKLFDPTTNISNIIIAEVDQKPYGVTTSSTAYVLGNKIVFLPQIDVKMVCVCPTLPNITHGTVTRPGVATVGSTAQYQCDPTHVLNGPSIRTCQADGTWSGVEPTCDKTCPTLEEMKHGTVEQSNGYEVGSIATYECNEPWEMNGCPTRVCLQDGTWSGEKPRCEVTSEMMCASVNQVVNRTLQLEGFSGSCDMSDNCVMTNCSLIAVFFPFPPQNIRSKVTYNPCDTPYSFHVVIDAPGFGTAVDEVISESKIVEFRIGLTKNHFNFNILQGYHKITISVTVNILGREIIIIPRGMVFMYCDDSTC